MYTKNEWRPTPVPSPRQSRSAADTSEELYQELDTALANPNPIFGYARFGDGKKWARLDSLTGGIQPKTLGVLAARPKKGKSMLAAGWIPYIARQAMDADQIVRVVTLEMQRKSYQRRMAAIMAKIKDPMNIRRGTLTAQEVKRYKNALDELAMLPIEYLSNEEDLSEEDALKRGNSPVTFEDMAAFVRRGDTFFWLLDHIGLLNDLDSRGDVTASIYSLANKLATLAHATATGLVITHLTRASAGVTPTIEHIAGSDQVGRNADWIMLLSRPFLDTPDLSEEDQAFIADGDPGFLQYQSRDEGSGLDLLWWMKEYAAFDELQLPEGEKVPMPKPKRKPGGR